MKYKLEAADRKISELEATVKDDLERLEFLRKEVLAKQRRISELEQDYTEAINVLKITDDLDYHMIACKYCIEGDCAKATDMQQDFEERRGEILIKAGEIEG